MALDEHKGVAGGYKIVYEDMDDATAQTGKWDAATESGNATKAVDDPDVMVYLGTFNSGAAKISIPILNKAGLVMISPANTAPELTKPGFDDATLNTLYDTSKPRNYFRVVTADYVQGVAAANWAKELGFKKAYIVNDQEVYGKGVANQFEKQFKANGGEVVTNEGIEKSQPDYKTLMSKVKDSGADLLYFGGLVDDGGPQVAKDLKAVAPNVQFMGPDGILTQAFIDAVGAQQSENMLGTVAGRQPKDLPSAGASFYTNFKTKMGHDPDPYAIFGYEAANVALNAIDKAGNKDRAAILKAVSETKGYEGALGKWDFDANGDTTLTDIQAFKAQGGAFVFQKYLTAGGGGGTAPTPGTGGGTGDKGTIKLVSSLPRTGLSKPQTDDIVAGINMALTEHNGVAGGYKITYEDMDDATAQTGKWDAATESGNATKAVDDQDVMVYLGTFNSGAAKISIPILNKAGLVMISPANTAPELTKPGFDDATLNTLYDTSKPRNYFRVVTADDVQGAAAANWATELGFKKAYIVNDQEVYGKGVANQFEKQFKAKGGTVIANEGIEKSQPDYKTLMSKVKDSGADLLYFGGLVDDGGPQVAKDLKAVAPNVQFMGPDGILTQAFIDAVGTQQSEGMLGTVAGRQPKDLPSKGAGFYTNFKSKMGHDPDPYAIFGYEAANVALGAIDKAATKDRAAILKAVSETKGYEGALGKWDFDANGDTTLSDIQAFKAQGGAFVFQKYLQK